MARYSPEQIEKSKSRLLHAAGRLFRLNGYNGVGVAEITHAAGLTNGTFYAHFKSKRHLFDTVIKQMTSTRKMFFDSIRDKSGGSRALAFVDWFLGLPHYKNIETGCLTPKLAGDMKAHRAQFPQTIDDYVLEFHRFFRSCGLSRRDAQFVASAMIGALTLARMLSQKEAENILKHAKKNIVDFLLEKIKNKNPKT